MRAGAPGTGKSILSNAIAEIMLINNAKTIMAAPTGTDDVGDGGCGGGYDDRSVTMNCDVLVIAVTMVTVMVMVDMLVEGMVMVVTVVVMAMVMVDFRSCSEAHERGDRQTR